MTSDTDYPKFNELQKYYNDYFSLGFVGRDISKKFALISLICFVVTKMKSKKPDITYYQVVYKLGQGLTDEKFINRLAIICEDFAYGCSEFPDFGIQPKDMPAKIRELLHNCLPF